MWCRGGGTEYEKIADVISCCERMLPTYFLPVLNEGRAPSVEAIAKLLGAAWPEVRRRCRPSSVGGYHPAAAEGRQRGGESCPQAKRLFPFRARAAAVHSEIEKE